MKYITQFDGIRAISVIFVCIGHWSAPSIKNVIPWGNIGVYTFFVLSGYLITSILLELKVVMTPGSALINFWGRRILRIFPIYYLTLTILLLLHHQPVSDYPAWHFTFLSNFLIMSPVGYQGTTDHLWSLAVECQFYLFWSIVILSTPNKYLPMIIISLLLLAPVSRLVLYILGMGATIKVFTFSSVDFLGIGSLVAFDSVHRKLIGFNTGNLLKRIYPLAIAVFLIVELMRNLGYHNIIYSLLETSCLVIYLGWLISETAKGINGLGKRVLESKLLKFTGRISYGLYLYHLFVSYYLTAWFNRMNLNEITSNYWLRFIIFLMGSYGLAIASWFLLEKPLLNLKKYFSLKYSKSSN